MRENSQNRAQQGARSSRPREPTRRRARRALPCQLNQACSCSRRTQNPSPLINFVNCSPEHTHYSITIMTCVHNYSIMTKPTTTLHHKPIFSNELHSHVVKLGQIVPTVAPQHLFCSPVHYLAPLHASDLQQTRCRHFNVKLRSGAVNRCYKPPSTTYCSPELLAALVRNCCGPSKT